MLVRQALDAGHEVVAVTRRPGEFPFTHPRLVIAGADARDGQAVYRAVEGSGAVLSSLGVPFTRKTVTVYSEGVSVITAVMSRLGVKRIAVVSSTAVEPHPHAEGGFMLNRCMQPLVSATIGKTTYADAASSALPPSRWSTSGSPRSTSSSTAASSQAQRSSLLGRARG
jgi:nucleoside-diphosphate-sugar epimerase